LVDTDDGEKSHRLPRVDETLFLQGLQSVFFLFDVDQLCIFFPLRRPRWPRRCILPHSCHHHLRRAQSSGRHESYH
jgi:hypothetical protein